MHPRSEVEITQFELRLKRQLGSRACNLRMLIRDEGVVLEGQAGSFYIKQIAQHAAMTITGLQVIANDIEVLWPLGSSSDENVDAAVQSAK